jgi:hypothetical protein
LGCADAHTAQDSVPFLVVQSGTSVEKSGTNRFKRHHWTLGSMGIVPFLYHFCTFAIIAPETLQFQRKVVILYHFTTFFSING